MATKKRKVLVILTNRYNPNQKPIYIELDCDDKGNILNENQLKTAPKKPEYDEVWESDEGKTSFSSCTRFKRKYRHPLERAK